MLSTLLLAWYDEHKRSLPFRGAGDPYRIWVSEIMLQQTRTETVGAYYQRFLAQFPDVSALAEAPEEAVLKCWEGLGYYSRARNLHRAAKEIMEKHGGAFPRTVEELRALPGVGDYTAAAVASIAFGVPAPAMDGNLTRVLSRVHGVRQDVGQPSVKRELLNWARQDMPKVRCGDFNQALMDLGATVCVPGTPECDSCPLRPLCSAYREGDAEDLPIKAAAKPPQEIQLAVALITCRGRIWMAQRKEALLKGLWVYALLEDAKGPKEAQEALKSRGIHAAFQKELGAARHVFTHRVWNMTVYHFQADTMSCREGRFVSLAEMRALPIPTAMRAAREHAVRLLSPEIRPLKEAALPAAAQAYAESWKKSHAAHCTEAFLALHTPERMADTLRSHQAKGRGVFALYLTGQAVGVLVIDQAQNELVSLYVHPDFQGLGIGGAAVAFALKQLDERRDMKVTVLQSNEAAIRLYEAYGFCRITEIRPLDEARKLFEEDRIRPRQETEEKDEA